jgi:hypothetical protein
MACVGSATLETIQRMVLHHAHRYVYCQRFKCSLIHEIFWGHYDVHDKMRAKPNYQDDMWPLVDVEHVCNLHAMCQNKTGKNCKRKWLYWSISLSEVPERIAFKTPRWLYKYKTDGAARVQCTNGRTSGRGAADCLLRCFTTGGTAPEGTECKFPFQHLGVTYSTCTDIDNSGIPSCYTDTQNSVWGNCNCNKVRMTECVLTQMDLTSVFCLIHVPGNPCTQT